MTLLHVDKRNLTDFSEYQQDRIEALRRQNDLLVKQLDEARDQINQREETIGELMAMVPQDKLKVLLG